MKASERWAVLQNIIAQKGIDSDLYAELAKVERMINAMEQGKMMPPPVPEQPIEPTMNQQQDTPTQGKYDNL